SRRDDSREARLVDRLGDVDVELVRLHLLEAGLQGPTTLRQPLDQRDARPLLVRLLAQLAATLAVVERLEALAVDVELLVVEEALLDRRDRLVDAVADT